jgi:hypothetical protein
MPGREPDKGDASVVAGCLLLRGSFCWREPEVRNFKAFFKPVISYHEPEFFSITEFW